MRIANPIYDVVFKYLMEDNLSAKLLLSTILGEEITELVFCPQEHTADSPFGRLTVHRLDFAATIKTAACSFRQVLIEIQKAKLPGDIMRFRRYLGNQYRRRENATIGVDGKKQALPLVTVYFLGYALEHTQAPVIHVCREITDVTTGVKLTEKEDFIESLTHDSYIIQIACLRPVHRTEVEKLLQVFDQTKIRDDRHVLEIDEAAVPEAYLRIVRRLFQAVADPKMADAMDIEDDVFEDLQEQERETAKAIERAERAEEKAEQAAQEAERERLEKEKVRVETERLQVLLQQAGIEF